MYLLDKGKLNVNKLIYEAYFQEIQVKIVNVHVVFFHSSLSAISLNDADCIVRIIKVTANLLIHSYYVICTTVFVLLAGHVYLRPCETKLYHQC